MKLIGINMLKAGEKLGYPIYTASGKVVLNAGSIITEAYLNRLKSLSISTIYIDDDQFGDIELVEAINVKTRSNANQIFRQIYEQYQKSKPFDEYKIIDTVKQIIDDIKSNGSTSINIMPSMAMDDYLAGHCINVCILSILIGNNMNYNYNQLVDLGVGAFIHDISRVNGDSETIEHVQKGFENIKKYRGISLHSAKILYEHHENYDGSGFPRKVLGSMISEYSKIVIVADNYDKLVLGEESKKRMLPHEAYEVLLAEADKKYDPSIVSAFRKAIAFYPNGCTVRLSNKQKGVVVRQNIGAPQRPAVRIVGEGQSPRDINLLTNLTLFIESVDIE